MCEGENYCKHCGTCHDCLGESIDGMDDQLAKAKAEIAELVDALSRLKEADMNVLIKGTKHIPTMRARQSALIYAVKTLAKHKGE